MNKSHRWSEQIRAMETDVEKTKTILTEISNTLTVAADNVAAAKKVLDKLFEEHGGEAPKK